MEKYIFKKILITKAFYDQKIDPHLQKFLISTTSSNSSKTVAIESNTTTTTTTLLSKLKRKMSSKIVDSSLSPIPTTLLQLTPPKTSPLNDVSLLSMIEGSRAEATFQLCIPEFSKFKESKENRLSAEPCIVRNLPWKILAISKQHTNKEFVLGFFLQCNADSDSNRWSVAATAELRLLHVSDPEKNLVKSKEKKFQITVSFLESKQLN